MNRNDCCLHDVVLGLSAAVLCSHPQCLLLIFVSHLWVAVGGRVLISALAVRKSALCSVFPGKKKKKKVIIGMPDPD